MATIKVKFRASTVIGKEGTLFYRVTHKQSVRQISTGCKIYPAEWKAETLSIPTGADTTRRRHLLRIKEKIDNDTSFFNHTIAKLDLSGCQYTADEVIKSFSEYTDRQQFIAFARQLISQMRRIGKARTVETYTCAVNSFIRFLNGKDVNFDAVDHNLISEYEQYLRNTGICPNSSSFYMRNLRAIYNRAAEKGLTAQRYPFKHVYTGISKTIKRAVPITTIKEIRDMDLRNDSNADYARDLFMFSFYTRGMSFIDMAFLKKRDLQNGFISYTRQKTGKRLTIKLERPMQEIIDKYDTGTTPYLLPIIRDAEKDERRQYKSAAHFVNSKLKKIGMTLGLPTPLTAYVARHAWASIAKSKNVPVSTISEAMGHDSEKTTRIYLATIDTSAVDEANRMILDAL